jgi:hypothetical protein
MLYLPNRGGLIPLAAFSFQMPTQRTSPHAFTVTSSGGTGAAKLEQSTGQAFKKIGVFQPPSTMYTFTNVVITSFRFIDLSNARGGSVTFSFNCQSVNYRTVNGGMNQSDSWNATP